MTDRRVIELVLLQIVVHGPSAIFCHLDLLNDLYVEDRGTYNEIAQELVVAGMDRRDVIGLLRDHAHGPHCACWACLLDLNANVLMATTIRRQRA